MNVITILAHKGGVGKTTLATNLAVAAQARGLSSAIVDVDPQGSSTFWGKRRSSGTAQAIPVHRASASSLETVLTELEFAQAELTFIDTAPGLDSDSSQICRLSDLILIPLQPSPVDLHAVSRTMAIADEARKPAYILLNLCPHYGRATEAAAHTILSEFRFPLLDGTIGRRVLFQKAYLHGLGVFEIKPKSKAAEEIKNVLASAIAEIQIQPSQKYRRFDA